jgi:hypothetical protein
MLSDPQEQWPEHAVCARCAAPLTDDYRESPLGLRFCKDCFDSAIQEKVKERAAAIYVKGHCSKCGRSLINGYRLNQFGVIYCLSCSGGPSEGASKPAAVDSDDSREQPERITGFEILLVVVLVAAHLLFFLDFLLSGRLFHGQRFFRPLVSLDLPTLILLAVLRHFSASWLSHFLTLLLSLCYIILVVKQIIVLAQ